MKKGLWFVMAMVLVLGAAQIAAAQQTYTLGAVHPYTGRFAFAGVHGQEAMKDAVDMANEAGGINGKKLMYYWKDGIQGKQYFHVFTREIQPHVCWLLWTRIPLCWMTCAPCRRSRRRSPLALSPLSDIATKASISSVE